jgi:uncharacterized SAM-binding protein YcdF (DUF218 family)
VSLDLFGRLARWLTVDDGLTHADAIFVLDGGEGGNRLATGLRVLAAGYAPRLLLSHSLYHRHDQLWGAEARARARADQVIWVYHNGTSTSDEAAEARRQLRRLGCRSVLVVTSDYHTRRTRMLFQRELRRAGIRVGMVAAPVPTLDGFAWPQSKTGRSVILFEVLKLVQVWLRLDWNLPPAWRLRLRTWAHQVVYLLSPGHRVTVSADAWEAVVESLNRPDPTRISDDSYLTALLAASARSQLGGRNNARDEPEASLAWMREMGEDEVDSTNFIAINITRDESEGYGSLAEAFNAWAQATRPAAIVHVHHYRDAKNHRIGYQIIYVGSAAEALEAEAEERRAA